MTTSNKRKTTKTLMLGLFPVVLLAAILYIIVKVGLPFFGEGGPPVEELTFEQITLQNGQITAEVRNTGHEKLTVAQVQVNEAYVNYSLDVDPVIPRLGTATITIPYHWVEDEPYEVVVVSSIGTTFVGEVGVAQLTPKPDAKTFGMFSLIGIFVGVIPVLLGLLWRPFLAKVTDKWYKFFLSVTVGLLAYLAVDAFGESFELAGEISGVLQGLSIIFFGIFSSMYVLTLINNSIAGPSKEGRKTKGIAVAYMVAIGIGLHNLGEGLAIGAAYTLGEVGLGAFLIIGFMIHNLTEGLAIVSPISKKKDTPKNLIMHLVILGLVAGGPAILGTWIGGFIYSKVLALLFLSIGIGAIAQVIYEITKMMKKKDESTFGDIPGGTGIIVGVLIMYVTGLFVIG